MNNEITIIKESAPHIRRKDSLNRMMLDVIIALLPIIIYSFVVSPLPALRNILVSVFTMELAEFIFVLIQNKLPYDGKKHTFKEHFENQKKAYRLSNVTVPLVSALIYALIMPTYMEPGYEYLMYFALVTGAVFGLAIGKLVFGGTGNNIFNPAAVGMVFAKLCFGGHFVYFDAFQTKGIIEAGATALGSSNMDLATGLFNPTGYSLLDLFLGRTPGLMGEACKLAILIGLIYLIIRHTIDWIIPLSYIGVFYLFMIIAGLILHGRYDSIHVFEFATYHLLAGGVIFGGVFMATDPVTSPITRPGRVLYGVVLATCTTFIRLFAALPEGVVYSILIGNMLVSVIDYPKWSTNKFNWKNIIWPIGVFLFFALIMIWALCVEVF